MKWYFSALLGDSSVRRVDWVLLTTGIIKTNFLIPIFSHLREDKGKITNTITQFLPTGKNL